MLDRRTDTMLTHKLWMNWVMQNMVGMQNMGWFIFWYWFLKCSTIIEFVNDFLINIFIISVGK